MANPFGGSDQALSKNTGHAKQENLLFAMVPRSTTKWREVINAADVTVGAGNYDADGYWRAGSSTRVDVGYTIGSPLAPNATLTVIAGLKYNSAGDVSVSYGHASGLYNDAETFSRFHVQCDRYGRDSRGQIMTSSGAGTNLSAAWFNPGADVFAFAVKRSGGSVNGLYRVGSTTTAAGSDTGVQTTNPWDVTSLNRVGVRAGTKWQHQYVFVYNAALSDSDINAIIDDPGAVITQTASGIDLAGSATAGATASATLAVQRNLAAAAVAGALASGTLSINRALTGAAIGAALGSATLTAFSSVWRIPTNAPNGTAVHATVFSGASPTYAILAQGTAIVAGGFVDIPGIGSIGAKAFAFVHNYADNTATSSIRGGPAIATLTSL
jgi:hypothetical protein